MRETLLDSSHTGVGLEQWCNIRSYRICMFLESQFFSAVVKKYKALGFFVKTKQML